VTRGNTSMVNPSGNLNPKSITTHTNYDGSDINTNNPQLDIPTKNEVPSLHGATMKARESTGQPVTPQQYTGLPVTHQLENSLPVTKTDLETLGGRLSTEKLHTEDNWITVSGRKSTQKHNTSIYWINGSSKKSTQQPHTMIGAVEHGTSNVS
jgi:hypothetical protein